MTKDLKLTIMKAQNGSKEAMSKLLDENINLVWNIVKKFNNRGYDKEDLFQIGCEGFIKAIKRFNFDFNTELSTYLVPVIMGEIKRFIRDDGIIKVSRSIKELSYRIYECREKYFKEKGKEITISELSKILEISEDDIIEAIECNVKPEYIESTVGNNEDGLTIFDKLSTNINEQEVSTNNLLIKQCLEELNDRDKQIILLRYYKQKTQTEISKILGISQVQVSRIEKKILKGLKQKIAWFIYFLWYYINIISTI